MERPEMLLNMCKVWSDVMAATNCLEGGVRKLIKKKGND